jgi:RimJ/RimL family protein N-acetyltransferase
MGHPLWPLFDLRVRTGDLELRLPIDDDLVELAQLARAGVHPPEEMPFAFAWTDLPSPQFERSFAQFHWSSRAGWKPSDWTLDLAVSRGGRLVGMQSLAAKDFPALRTVNTGSWLGQKFQRQGIGRQMRQAVLALAFDHLGADAAESGAFLDNPASSRVSEALGYEPNGVTRAAPRGTAREMLRYRMTREGWQSRPRPAVEVDGLDGCLELFGIVTPAPDKTK